MTSVPHRFAMASASVLLFVFTPSSPRDVLTWYLSMCRCPDSNQADAFTLSGYSGPFLTSRQRASTRLVIVCRLVPNQTANEAVRTHSSRSENFKLHTHLAAFLAGGLSPAWGPSIRRGSGLFRRPPPVGVGGAYLR